MQHLNGKTHFSLAVNGKIEPSFLKRRVDQSMLSCGERHWLGHTLRGQAPHSGSVQMRTNDYLSIARDIRILKAEITALQVQGHGEAISQVFVHDRLDQHRAFERRFAQLMQAEDAVLCMSGYCANT